jgi:serine protease Do
MKTFMYKLAPLGILCISLGQGAMAQPDKQPIPPKSPDAKEISPERGDQTEIIIRQKGDKDSKLTLEIKNGEYFINGKPLDKFEDGNIVIERREMKEDMDMDMDLAPNISDGPSPFRMNPGDQERMQRDIEKMQRDLNNVEMQKRIQKSIQIRMNSAFLGVSSRKAEKGGATVLEVTKGSPAEKAGIKKGDIITKVNEEKIESPENLFEIVHNYKPGDKVKISFTRDGKEQTVSATLDKSEYTPKNYNYNYNFKMPPMPPMPEMDGFHMGPWGPHAPKLGIKAQDAEDGKGVNVLEVEDSSAAAKAGLKKGDIILQFEGSEVNSTNDLIEELDKARQKNIVKVKILRGTAPQELEIKIPRKLKTAEL